MSQELSGETHATGRTTVPITQRRILVFFAPLAVSWIFMSLEGPITTGIISRRPGETVALAGMNLLMALCIFIESPVIDLLSTSTTLCKTHSSYLVIRRFTLVLMFWTAAAQALVTLTPLYWVVVEQWIRAPHEVAVVLRTPMAIMVPWASFVGWRRFHQGILIRFDNTRPIGIGTGVRVASVFVVGVALFVWTDLPGLTVAAFALLASVFAEAAFVHFAARPTVRRHLDPTSGTPQDRGIEVRRLCAFHFPLTVATMTMILSMPLVSAALARSPDSTRALAAWGLAMGVVFLFRSITFALPETVIALYRDEHTREELGRFCARVGLCCSGAVLVAYYSGAATFLFNRVLDTDITVARHAAFALLVSVLVPAVNSHASFVRGLLTAHHRTGPRLVAIVAGVAGLVVTLVAGVAARWDGLLVIGAAMTVQVGAELAVLSAFWAKSGKTAADLS